MLNLLINKLRLNERGASMVEYALLVVLIAIVGLVAVNNFGGSVAGTYESIANALVNAGGN